MWECRELRCIEHWLTSWVAQKDRHQHNQADDQNYECPYPRRYFWRHVVAGFIVVPSHRLTPNRRLPRLNLSANYPSAQLPDRCRRRLSRCLVWLVKR